MKLLFLSLLTFCCLYSFGQVTNTRSSVCDWLEKPLDFNQIQKHVKQVDADVCGFRLLEMVTDEVIINNNKHALTTFDSICCHSDGALSEYIDELAANIFTKNLKVLLPYLAQNPKSCIRFYTIVGLSFQVSSAKDRKAEKESIRKLAEAQAKAGRFTASQNKYLQSLLSKVDHSLVE